MKFNAKRKLTIIMDKEIENDADAGVIAGCRDTSS
jgi:hypothetical protein